MSILLTLNQVAMRLNIPPRSVYRLIRLRAFEAVRIGKLIRVRETDLEAYLKELHLEAKEVASATV